MKKVERNVRELELKLESRATPFGEIVKADIGGVMFEVVGTVGGAKVDTVVQVDSSDADALIEAGVALKDAGTWLKARQKETAAKAAAAEKAKASA